MGVTLRGRNLSSFHPSGMVAGGGVGVFSPLTGGGSEIDLVIVTCTQSWFPGLPGVEPFNGDAGIFEAFCPGTRSCPVLENNRSTWHGIGVSLDKGESL